MKFKLAIAVLIICLTSAVEGIVAAEPTSFAVFAIGPSLGLMVKKLKSVVASGLADRLQRFKDAAINAILKKAAEQDQRKDLKSLMRIIQVATAVSLVAVITDELVELLRKLLHDEDLIQEVISLGPNRS